MFTVTWFVQFGAILVYNFFGADTTCYNLYILVQGRLVAAVNIPGKSRELQSECDSAPLWSRPTSLVEPTSTSQPSPPVQASRLANQAH